jgi:hypothetical protein
LRQELPLWCGLLLAYLSAKRLHCHSLQCLPLRMGRNLALHADRALAVGLVVQY